MENSTATAADMTPEDAFDALMKEVEADIRKENAGKAKRVIRAKLNELVKARLVVRNLENELELIKADIIAGGDGRILPGAPIDDDDEDFSLLNGPARRRRS